MARSCSMDGVVEQFGEDEMMGRRRPRVPVARLSAPKKAIAAKAASTARAAQISKAAAKQVAKSSAPSQVKREAAAIASEAKKLAARAQKLSQMSGVEPVLMGDAGDFYNIGSAHMGAIEQFSGVEPVLMGDADFGAIEQFSGEDDGMMGGLMDTLKSPVGMAAVAVGAWMLWKKLKK